MFASPDAVVGLLLKSMGFPVVHVRHERPDAGTSFEVAVPMELRVGAGQIVRIKSLAPNGIRLTQKLEIAPARGDLQIPFQGYNISVPVAFDTADASDFLPFGPLESRARQMIDLFHRSVLTGEMVAADTVISRLDTPVDLIAMEETKAERTARSVSTSQRFWKIAGPAAFYFCLIATMVVLFGEKVIKRLNAIPLEHARIEIPLSPHLVKTDGYITDVLIAPGDVVTQGQRLVLLADPAASAAIDKVRGDITLAERRVARTRADLSLFEGQTSERESALRNALALAIANRRIADFLGHYDMEAVLSAQAKLQAFLRDNDDKSIDNAMRRTELLNRLEEETAQLRRLRRTLGQKKRIGAQGDILAESDGVVSTLNVVPGQYVLRGDTVLALERDEPRFIHGYVAASRATQLFLGMPVDLSLRTAEGYRRVRGRLAEFSPSDPNSATDGVAVHVAPVSLDLAEARHLFWPGAPVKAAVDLNRFPDLSRWWRERYGAD